MDDPSKTPSSGGGGDNPTSATTEASLMSPIPKKKRPSQTQASGATTTAAATDDLLGHVPRKKKDPAPHSVSLPSLPRTSNSSAAESIPKKTVAAASTHPTTTTAPRTASQVSLGMAHHHSAGGDSSLASQRKRSFSSMTNEGPAPPPPAAPAPAPPPKRHFIQVISENPIVLKIQTKDVPMSQGGIGRRIPSSTPSPPPPKITSSSQLPSSQPLARMRQAKKSNVHYEEAALTDSDDLMDTDEEEDTMHRRKKKKRRLGGSAAAAATLTATGTIPTTATSTTTMAEAEAPVMAPLVFNPLEATPPEGTLSTLWYSREVFLNIFVLEKVVGWKVRPVVRLLTAVAPSLDDATTTAAASSSIPEPFTLDLKEAQRWQEKALQTPVFWNDMSHRMSISRANPVQCPLVMQLAATAEAQQAKAEGRAPRFVLQTVDTTTEEVLLVKWRGRSHLHCSWERSMDIQRIDAGANNTAKQKIKRYYQSQEVAYGLHWKKTLQEDRDTAATIHSHGETETVGKSAAETAATTASNGEEYFPVQCLELERILACDESEMDMNVLAVQRAKNMKTTAAEERLEEARKGLGAIAEKGHEAILDRVLNAPEVSESWDAEDNVRYIVKWKGLPYAEMTWEYWRDIKRDAVDLAEDFWYRQQPPTSEEIRDAIGTAHPSVRDFKKLQESPVYGISSRLRPVAHLEGVPSNVTEEEESTFEGFRLRSYQLEGVNWLLFNWWNKRSCILADEMGLGKTIQSAAFMHQLQSNPLTKIRGPFLIVAPLSLVTQWQSELATWAPDMNVILYHGSADAREFLVDQEFYYNDPFVPKATAVKFKKQGITKFHVLITTYEVCLKDAAVLSKIKWRLLIVDEAHRLKNHKSRLFQELASVNRQHTLLLTGTPISNATDELFSLLHFANPQTFRDRDDFIEKFGQMTDVDQVNELHSLLRPFLLRRVKEDVEKSLPPKEETILEVSLTPIQKAYYKAIYERNTAFLFKGAKANNAPSLMNVMMELRKCCNHPFLVRGAEERILADAASRSIEKATDEGKPPLKPEPYQVFAEQLVKSSGKMVLMEKLLQKLFDGGHKVLVFSQMVRVLDLLEELLRFKRYRYERLDGSTSSSSRLAAVDRFKRKSCQRFVMLLSTRAGGLGLNLTAADTVIIFDSDWNPQNDLQAMARAHRIGQQRSVKIYRLLTAKTYEMHMFHSASLKLGLERAVLSQNREQGDDNDDPKSKKKSDKEAQAKEIDELLKKGAYDVFRDDDDAEAEKFMETDIDQLLENSSKKVTYGASATSSLGNGLGSFSKASFVTDTGSGEKDVDLDDPDFWAKAVGLDVPVETPEEVAAMLDDGVKRSRKQVQVYDPYAETAEAEQRKKEKVAMEKMLEKEEKERARLEKKLKKEALKEKRKREKEQKQQQLQQQAEKKAATAVVAAAATSSASLTTAAAPQPTSVTAIPAKLIREEVKKAAVEGKPKKSKKSNRQRALRRAENENPILEQLRQAWEVQHRNRASAAILRFGFKRFCKIRSEASLNSLPLQDLEVFTRSFLYQIALQAGVNLMKVMNDSLGNDIRSQLRLWLGDLSCHEVEWIANSIVSAVKQHREVEAKRRFLRIPVILCEPSYVADLRNGCAVRALRRLGILARLNSFVEKCLDKILIGLGHEELGKRGCASSDLSCLDPDMKARFVTTEELSLVISLGFKRVRSVRPATWWDRYCDVALVVGTFVHGLSNYKAMRTDPDLPFSEKIKRSATLSYRASYQAFVVAASSAREVFDDALEAGRVKAELEVQAAVAAAAKAASKREEDAARLREGGDDAEDVIRNMPETQVENAFEFDGTDSHFVTLRRLHSRVRETLAKKAEEVLSPDTVPEEFNEGTIGRPRAEGSTGRPRSQMMLSMPDSRLLDHRLLEILAAVEDPGMEQSPSPEDEIRKLQSETASLYDLRNSFLSRFYGDRYDCFLREYAGVGLAGAQCGTTHRTLNDGTDFAYGPASPPLSQVAYGTDAPRYLRALGVPMNVTRFAIAGLSYADKKCVDQLLFLENKKFYEDDDVGDLSPSKAGVASIEALSHERKEELTTRPGDVKSELDKMQPKDDVRSGGESSPRKEPLDPPNLVPDAFRDNAKLRALVCLGVLMYGFPTSELSTTHVDVDVIALIGHDEESLLPFFDKDRFRQSLLPLSDEMFLPDASAIAEFVQSSLLPHCLRLCLYGNGPTTRDARGSQGEYETALGVSLHCAPSTHLPCPLPDPCLELSAHSLESLGVACAILRRTQLLRAAQYLCGGVSNAAERISEASKSKVMDFADNLPVWWCPWVHDVGLLIRAASDGLFAVMENRTGDKVFSEFATGNFLRTSLENHPIADHFSSPETLNEWIGYEATRFPTLLQVERRLAFLCSKATSTAKVLEDRFVVIPMFDHGGWPRD